MLIKVSLDQESIQLFKNRTRLKQRFLVLCGFHPTKIGGYRAPWGNSRHRGGNTPHGLDLRPPDSHERCQRDRNTKKSHGFFPCTVLVYAFLQHRRVTDVPLSDWTWMSVRRGQNLNVLCHGTFASKWERTVGLSVCGSLLFPVVYCCNKSTAGASKDVMFMFISLHFPAFLVDSDIIWYVWFGWCMLMFTPVWWGSKRKASGHDHTCRCSSDTHLLEVAASGLCGATAMPGPWVVTISTL